MNKRSYSKQRDADRKRGRRAELIIALLGLMGGASTVGAEEATTEVVTLPPLVVRGETFGDRTIQGPFMAEVVGTTIYAGKKTSVVDFDAMPQIQTDNYRQAFAKTPGLLTSELSNSSLLSLSYRGIGDPHESQNLMVLKDGLPFVLDSVGYPTVYYAPPFESLDRLEFTAGGGALLYGAQPSGALNYITHAPDRSASWGINTQHIVGSDNLYSTFSTLEGGNGRFGYLANFDHRSGNSFRSQNSDFELNGGDLKLVHDLSSKQRLTASFERYDADHGEPGGLTAAAYAADPDRAFLAHDRVRLGRTQGVVGHEYVGEQAYWQTRLWASEVVRYSKRQNVSGGFLNSGTTFSDSNTINQHTYETLAVDSRLRLDYSAVAETSTLTVGTTLMDIDAPIWNEAGSTADADRGTRTYQAGRSTRYAAVFAENLFRLDRFTLTPSVRGEFIRQEIDEQIRSAGARDLRDDTATPLWGLGSTYATTQRTEAYANISTAYKPATYGDVLPTAANTRTADLQEARVVNYELGHRGRPTPWSSYDLSLFVVDYRNRITSTPDPLVSSGTLITNDADSLNCGVSAFGEIDLYDLVNGPSPFSVAWHVAYQYLDAEFTSGDFRTGGVNYSLEGRAPQYSPEHMVRTGLIVSQDRAWKVALLLTHLSDHFADDANRATWKIPAYTVLDVTAEARLWTGAVASREAELWLLAGLNNALGEVYFSRVRANGIDPANGRNYYVGLRAEF